MSLIFCGKGKIGEVCLKLIQKKFKEVHVIKDSGLDYLLRDTDRKIDEIKQSDYKYVFLAGWNQMISNQEIHTKKFINFHGSLLPKFRGLHSLYWMIMNDEEYLGYTIHEVNEFMDDGDIIYQYKFKYSNELIYQIHQKFYDDLQKNLIEILEKYMENKVELIKQDKTQASWVPRRNLNDCLIDFTMPVTFLKRFFLALSVPYPLPKVEINGEFLDVSKSFLVERDIYCEVGRVVNIDNEGVWITVRDGYLVVQEVKNQESESLNLSEKFYLGQRLF